MKTFKFLPLVLLAAFVLSACVAQAQAVLLDPELVDWIGVGATVLVGFVLVQLARVPFLARLIEYFKIEQYTLVISAWLAGVIVQFVQTRVLDQIPQELDSVVALIMRLAVAIIVTLYGFRRLADRGVRGFLPAGHG